jgi:hypothetical protein
MEVRGVLIVPEVFPDIAIPHVRWCLNKPGLLSGPKSYPKGVICFHYSSELEESAKAAAHDGTSTEFMLGTIEMPEIIHDERPISLYYGGKYTGLMQEHPLSLELTRNWPTTKKKYWELMDMAHELYSYDSFSAVNAEAYLMGLDVNIWNGSEWKAYTAPDYIDHLLFNDERNKAATVQFLDTIKAHM